MILRFNQYISEEVSKNDPIPEIQRIDKLGIILLGTPGIGKSTFIKNFISPKRGDIKVFSTDDVSLTMTKSPDVYYPKASELNLDRLLTFIESGKPFIYDTTGTNLQNIERIWRESKSNDFTTIFIHLIGRKEQAQIGNISRIRKVPKDYLDSSFNKQLDNMKVYLGWNPDAYYLVSRDEFGYGWWKIENNQVLKRNEIGGWDKSSFDDLSVYF